MMNFDLLPYTTQNNYFEMKYPYDLRVNKDWM